MLIGGLSRVRNDDKVVPISLSVVYNRPCSAKEYQPPPPTIT